MALEKNGFPAQVIEFADMPQSSTVDWNVVRRILNERRWLETYLRLR